jgi:hypothetical protein
LRPRLLAVLAKAKAQAGSKVCQLPVKRIAFGEQLFQVVQGEERLGRAVHGPAAQARLPEDLDLVAFIRIPTGCRVLGCGHDELLHPQRPVVTVVNVNHDGGVIGKASEVVDKPPYGEHDRRVSGMCALAQALARLTIPMVLWLPRAGGRNRTRAISLGITVDPWSATVSGCS